MIDNIQGQVPVPENPIADNGDVAESSAEMSEVSRAASMPAPQPSAPADDKVAAQNIANTLQNSQIQQQPPVQANPANAGQAPVRGKTKKDSEPYIKAAEGIIEKDRLDPYQEESDHEDVQIQYLKDRFGKDVKKG